MRLKQFQNNEFGSNTYLWKEASQRDAFIFDIGEFYSLKNELIGYNVPALFLTHCHFDHIYYINELVQAFPEIKIFAHEITIEALKNPKTNLSFYRECPVCYIGTNVFPLKNESQHGELKIGQTKIKWFYTPGHHSGCISFEIGNYLVTGDSFIPGIPVVTKLKEGDKIKSVESLFFLKSKMAKGSFNIASGHGDIMSAEETLFCEKNKKNPSIIH